MGRTVSVKPNHSTCTIRNVSEILFSQQQSDIESEGEENDNEESIKVTKETNNEETISFHLIPQRQGVKVIVATVQFNPLIQLKREK